MRFRQNKMSIMAIVKQEAEFGSDQWLLDSVQVKKEIKEEKPNLFRELSDIKCKSDEDEEEPHEADIEVRRQRRQVFENGNEKLANSDLREVNQPWWEKAMESASMSEAIADLCRYKCPKCSTVYTRRHSLSKHLRKRCKFVGAKTSLSGLNQKNYLCKIVVHKCKIGHKRILCDMKEIVMHINMHKIKTKQQYENMTVKEMEKRQKLWSEWDKIQKIKCHTKREKIMEKNSSVSEEIGSLCRYQCQVCKQSYFTSSGIRYHFEVSQHNEPTTANTISSLTKVVVYKCLICFETIFCDRYFIRGHLYNNHGVNLKEYLKTTKVKELKFKGIYTDTLHRFYKTQSTKHEATRKISSLCSFLCTHCDFHCHNWDSMTRHVSSKSHGPLLGVTEYISKVTFHKCHVCDEVILCDTQYIANHV